MGYRGVFRAVLRSGPGGERPHAARRGRAGSARPTQRDPPRGEGPRRGPPGAARRYRALHAWVPGLGSGGTAPPVRPGPPPAFCYVGPGPPPCFGAWEWGPPVSRGRGRTMKVKVISVLEDNYMYLVIEENTRDAIAVDAAVPKRVRTSPRYHSLAEDPSGGRAHGGGPTRGWCAGCLGAVGASVCEEHPMGGGPLVRPPGWGLDTGPTPRAVGTFPCPLNCRLPTVPVSELGALQTPKQARLTQNTALEHLPCHVPFSRSQPVAVQAGKAVPVSPLAAVTPWSPYSVTACATLSRCMFCKRCCSF